MKIRLVSYSKPTIEFEKEGIKDLQELVAFCARVSNPSNQNNQETSKKLINYLIKNKHWSPLEMVTACIEIETTRDIARQILRHRSFSFQEFSQRYADPTKDLSFVLREARMQDVKNRQNSIDTDDMSLKKEWDAKQQKLIDLSLETYKWAIDNGIAR
jgi:thymidylate synthase (FAD)